jgi:hypothetical protein
MSQRLDFDRKAEQITQNRKLISECWDPLLKDSQDSRCLTVTESEGT